MYIFNVINNNAIKIKYCRAKFRTSPKIVPLAYANNVSEQRARRIEAKINLEFCEHICRGKIPS